jgi:hypothetical protein
MKYPTPDLYDRYTIELLKNERAEATNQTHIDVLKSEIDKRGLVQPFIDELKEVNGKIWDLESDIRKGREGELGLEEVGRRAIQIRQLNNLRIIVKNQVASHFGEFNENKKRCINISTTSSTT